MDRDRYDAGKPGSVAIAAISAFILIMSSGFFRGALRGPIRIDEAHKISETAFAKLVMRRDFRHQAWLEEVIDRTNPPVGKYYFGSFIGLSGKSIPEVPTLSSLAEPDGFLRPNFSESETDRFREALVPSRFGSLFATAITGAIVASVAMHTVGSCAAFIATSLFATNWLVLAYGSTAVFDPLLAMLMASGGWMVCRFRDLRLRGAMACGVLGALAFQTRFTGLLLLASVALLQLTLNVKRGKQLLRWSFTAAATFLLVAVAINPYYWVPPDSGSFNPARWIARFSTQLRNMSDLVSMLERRGMVIRSSSEKVDLIFQNLFGDPSGLILAGGVILGVAAAVRLRAPKLTLVLLAWSAFVIIAFLAWLQVAWPRYLLPLVAPLCWISAFGWSEFVAASISAVKRLNSIRQNQTS